MTDPIAAAIAAVGREPVEALLGLGWQPPAERWEPVPRSAMEQLRSGEHVEARALDLYGDLSDDQLANMTSNARSLICPVCKHGLRASKDPACRNCMATSRA